MTVIAKPPPRDREVPRFPYDRLQRFSVGQYHRMIASGALTEDDPVELLEGWLVAKMPRDPHHDGCIFALQTEFLKVLPSEWLVRVQSAVTTKDSEPEPDLAIVTGPKSKYFEHHPGRAEVGLIVEVANTTLDDDRTVKGRIYARVHFPNYWIVNLEARRIEVYSSPRGGKSASYQELKDYPDGARIPIYLSGKTYGQVIVNDILPPK